MKEQIPYSAALDFSSNAATFAVATMPEHNIVINATKAMNGRSSASLLPWMLSLLQSSELSLSHIKKWTVGSGPGSFTGMRLAAALIEGITMLQQEVTTRCLPSAFALAAPFPAGSRTAVIFDGRNRELLLFGVESQTEKRLVASGGETILNRETAGNRLDSNNFDYLTALEKDRDAIAKIIPEAIFNRIKFQSHIDAATLLKLESSNWDNNLTQLCYIRPAVFS